MADPLSITASIVAMLQAAGAIARGIGTIRSAAWASKEVALLRRDVDDLVNTMSILQSHLERRPHLNRDVARMLESKLLQAKAIVEELHNMVTIRLIRTATGRVKKSSYMWADLSGDIKRQRQNLTSVMNSLSFVSILGLL